VDAQFQGLTGTRRESGSDEDQLVAAGMSSVQDVHISVAVQQEIH
jgi:hypothetical protein